VAAEQRVDHVARLPVRAGARAGGEQDLFAPISAPDTGTADVHAIAPVPGIGRYLVHQVFAFKAAQANATPAPTLAVNGLAAGPIALPNGDPLVPGDIAAVAGLYDEKARLLKTLELHQPRIEPFLREGGEPVAALRGLIRDLADQIQVNGRLLKGMAEASRSILGEIERTRSRQSLRGLYDKSGQLRSTAAPDSGNLRKTL